MKKSYVGFVEFTLIAPEEMCFTFLDDGFALFSSSCSLSLLLVDVFPRLFHSLDCKRKGQLVRVGKRKNGRPVLLLQIYIFPLLFRSGQRRLGARPPKACMTQPMSKRDEKTGSVFSCLTPSYCPPTIERVSEREIGRMSLKEILLATVTE